MFIIKINFGFLVTIYFLLKIHKWIKYVFFPSVLSFFCIIKEPYGICASNVGYIVSITVKVCSTTVTYRFEIILFSSLDIGMREIYECKYLPRRASECQCSSFWGSLECVRPEHCSAQNTCVTYLNFITIFFICLFIFNRKN